MLALCVLVAFGAWPVCLLDSISRAPTASDTHVHTQPHTPRTACFAICIISHAQWVRTHTARASRVSHVPGSPATCWQVRFIDMDIKWGPGAPTWPSGSTEAGLALSPVYVPAYVFSWWHGGTKASMRQCTTLRCKMLCGWCIVPHLVQPFDSPMCSEQRQHSAGYDTARVMPLHSSVMPHHSRVLVPCC